jgi:hypothetical protein
MNKDVPMGLALASVDQLRNHYEQVKKSSGVPDINSVI